MISGRPRSHIVTLFFFATMSWAGMFSGIEYLEAGNPQAAEQWMLLIPYLLAAAAWFYHSRASYLFCAFILFVAPAFLAYQCGVLLFATPAPFLEVVPVMLVTSVLYWLFHAFTFGSASRDFYAEHQSPSIIETLKSYLLPKPSKHRPRQRQSA